MQWKTQSYQLRNQKQAALHGSVSTPLKSCHSGCTPVLCKQNLSWTWWPVLVSASSPGYNVPQSLPQVIKCACKPSFQCDLLCLAQGFPPACPPVDSASITAAARTFFSSVQQTGSLDAQEKLLTLSEASMWQQQKYSSFPAVSMPCFWHETESEFESTSTWYPCLSWSDSEHLKVVSLGVSTMPPKTGLWSQLRISDPSIITEYNMFFLVAEVFLHHTLLPVLLKYQRFSALGKFWAVTQKWKKLLILDLCLHKPLEQQHPD